MLFLFGRVVDSGVLAGRQAVAVVSGRGVIILVVFSGDFRAVRGQFLANNAAYCGVLRFHCVGLLYVHPRSLVPSFRGDGAGLVGVEILLRNFWHVSGS